MPILCVCPNGHSLRVKDKLAGQRGKCPTCGADFDVPPLEPQPTEGGPPPLSIQPAAAADAGAPRGPNAPGPAAAVAEAPAEWRMAWPDGQQFGPTVPTVFAQWIAAGRVSPDTLVWRTGWPDWRRADATNADLPAPLPKAEDSTPPPLPGVTLPPPLPATPSVAPTAPTGTAPTGTASTGTAPTPTAKPSRPVTATSAYTARRRQQAKRRQVFTILLALVCLVLAGLLVVMATRSTPATVPARATQTP